MAASLERPAHTPSPGLISPRRGCSSTNVSSYSACTTAIRQCSPCSRAISSMSPRTQAQYGSPPAAPRVSGVLSRSAPTSISPPSHLAALRTENETAAAGRMGRDRATPCLRHTTHLLGDPPPGDGRPAPRWASRATLAKPLPKIKVADIAVAAKWTFWRCSGSGYHRLAV
jgi:hypothetical protein